MYPKFISRLLQDGAAIVVILAVIDFETLQSAFLTAWEILVILGALYMIASFTWLRCQVVMLREQLTDRGEEPHSPGDYEYILRFGRWSLTLTKGERRS